MFCNIQVLRALAALLVVWAHLRELLPAVEANPRVPSGLAGVDLFFVISGFIMVVSTNPGDRNAGRFLWKRLIRVLPLYYIATFLVFVLTLMLPRLFKSSTSEMKELVLSLLFIPFLKSEGRIYPTYYLGWTLNYEMFFYLLFSIGVLLGGRLRVVFPTVIIITLCVVGSRLVGLEGGSTAVFVYTRPILLNFVLGMLIGLCPHRLGRAAVLAPSIVYAVLATGAAGLVCFASAFNLSSTSMIAPPTDTVFRFGIWAALIVAAAVALEEAGRVIGNKILLLLGNASYSLYLSHFFVVAVAKVVALRLDLTFVMRIPLAIATLIACVVVAVVSYRYLELPITVKLRSLFDRRWLPLSEQKNVAAR